MGCSWDDLPWTAATARRGCHLSSSNRGIWVPWQGQELVCNGVRGVVGAVGVACTKMSRGKVGSGGMGKELMNP